MGINTKINQFKNNMVNVINESGMPPAVIKIVLENIINQIDIIEKTELEKEAKEQKEGEQGNDSEND